LDKRRFEELFPEPQKKEKGAARDSDPAFFIHMKQTMHPAAPWQFPKSDSAIPHHNPIWKRRFVFSSTAAACLIVALMLPHISSFLQMSEDTDRVDVTIDTKKDKTDDIKTQAAADDYGNREDNPADPSIDQTIQSASAEEGKETGDTKTDSAQKEPIENPDRIKDIEKPNTKQPDTEKEKLNRNRLDTEKEKPNRNQLDTEKEKPNRNQLGTEKQKPNRKQPDKEKLDIKQSDIKEPDQSISDTVTGVSDKNEEPSDNSEAAEDTVVSDHDNSAQEESDQALTTENDQSDDNVSCDTNDMAVDDASSPEDSVMVNVVDASDDKEVDEDVPEDVFLPYRYLYLPNTGYWYVCCGGSDDKESALDPYDLGNVIVSNERDFANTVRMEAVGNLEDNRCVYITFVNQGNTCYYRYEKLRDQ